MGVLFIVVTIKGRLRPDDIVAPAVYFMLAVPGSVVILFMRRRFLTLPKATQLCIAWLTMAITAIAYILLFDAMH